MKINYEWPGIGEIRSSINEKERIKEFFLGLFHFSLPLIVWMASFAGIIFAPWWAKIFFGYANGHSLGVMILIGHDALHGTLFSKRWMNRLVGRISMALTFHPVTSWVHAHNGLHHGFTNIKGKDIASTPLSLKEYRNLSFLGKCSYRVTRSWYGCSWLYFKETWFQWMFFPIASRAPRNSKAFFRDRLQLAIFFVAWISLLIWSAIIRGENPFFMITCGFIFPQFVASYFIGFITMQQHTHPKVAWYSELDSPSPAFFQAQLHSTPHLVFPYFVRLFMRNIMEHTAHHADPGNIPLYSLPEAQKSLERFFGDQILYENWTPFTFLRTTRICRLYDYSTHQWIDYDGKPLTESLYERYLKETKVDELQSVAY